MALKETIASMKTLLCHVTKDLEKACGGNKAASQRVRTGSIKLEKVAKRFRKESVVSEKKGKKGGGKKKGKAAPKRATAKAVRRKK
ncbi:MAG TPA: histone [Parachlamydiales bacterium]|nr:MAG: hypothetical protein A3D18_00725 [Chlamydiae bacterium RIFCSPHIGHO2_02_FULL_49_29]OGN64206.1 MAG: hypothetical protein A3E26_04070 [Chlamydiae bacterium RIFCSPHIGHO2_12_FULL_49_32]OGN68041.1 MAG: hypothetical protein A3I15_00150 [Chlamydiae bacterium RIFCSPLOWO2_02_FULL_49_12]OGN70960.1 MAG: hypothetical protein A3G30_06415 [Chlamydiae bacterium RIFCSPLOWO2_12_FULL_49_12]HAZ16190.1 histone [Parachlamydiales bacterium]